MFFVFRSQLSELRIALYLTRQIESLLDALGAEGKSLSDKVKSFDDSDGTYDEDDREERFRYREYKRSLIGGYYNDLRWIAHERNMLMHKNDYFINDFKKFKLSCHEIILYLKKEANKNIEKKESFIVFYHRYAKILFFTIMFLIIVNTTLKTSNLIVSIFFISFVASIFLRKQWYEFESVLIKFRKRLLLIPIIILMWDIKFENIQNLGEQLDKKISGLTISYEEIELKM